MSQVAAVHGRFGLVAFEAAATMSQVAVSEGDIS
jgi:hypothetical protein